MVLCGFLNSVEFYVIAAVAAAAVLGLCVRPSSRSAARQWLLSGTVSPDDSGDPTPRVTIRCLPDGNVEVTRYAIPGIGTDGAVSMVAELSGQDLTLDERIVEGTDAMPGDLDCARWVFDFLGRDRYYVRYTSAATELMYSGPLHNREGIVITRNLRR